MNKYLGTTYYERKEHKRCYLYFSFYIGRNMDFYEILMFFYNGYQHRIMTSKWWHVGGLYMKDVTIIGGGQLGIQGFYSGLRGMDVRIIDVQEN